MYWKWAFLFVEQRPCEHDNRIFNRAVINFYDEMVMIAVILRLTSWRYLWNTKRLTAFFSQISWQHITLTFWRLFLELVLKKVVDFYRLWAQVVYVWPSWCGSLEFPTIGHSSQQWHFQRPVLKCKVNESLEIPTVTAD